jgi:hypothetical protein
MAHFAEINDNSIVTRVLVVPNEEEADGQNYLANVLGLGGNWIKTSYNGNIRKNFAGIGYTYDSNRDAFIAQEPMDSMGFDEATCQWIVPEIEQ